MIIKPLISKISIQKSKSSKLQNRNYSGTTVELQSWTKRFGTVDLFPTVSQVINPPSPPPPSTMLK